MRRLLILASAMVFFDVTFYAAIAPLLPDYVAEFGLSKAGAGVLTASYAAGTLLASLPAGLVASRFGPRRTVIAGLLVLGVASVVFGFGGSIAMLDAARFAQGMAGALIWSGALTWLITAAPDERRGSVIGTALGAAVAGALLGPRWERSRRRSAPSRSSARCSPSPSCSRSSPLACRRRAHRRRRTCARSPRRS